MTYGSSDRPKSRPGALFRLGFGLGPVVWCRSIGRTQLMRLLLLRGAPAIAFRVHLQDRRVVNESVDGGQRHRRIDEDVVPLRERRVGRDRDALALVSFRDQFEEHRRFSLIAADVAQVVELC